MSKKLFSIGSIVKIKDFEKRVLIVGFRGVDDSERIYDYIGFVYPYGFLDRQNVILFDNDAILDIINLGYKTIEDEEFKKSLYENYYKESGE